MNAPLPTQATHIRPQRTPSHPVDPIFVRRWSPRAFDTSPMSRADLMTMLEAARWAPSAYNIQPWRFIYALRGDESWQDFVDLLDPSNASWAARASALVFVVSDRLTPARGSGSATPSRTHQFDTGAAWAHLALQATMLGYQAHAMAGIHYDAVRERLVVPESFQIEIAVAIGRRASPETLPEELQARELPSDRLPLAGLAFAGRFGAELRIQARIAL